MIEINNLTFQYPDGKIALNGISLQVRTGERIALIGPNGAGKSTLLLHLNGVLQGDGQVRINNLDISKKNLPTIRASVGVIFQNPDDQLFSLTVAEDVAFGPRYQGLNTNTVTKKVKNALTAVNMEGFEDRHPFHLSGGEKKKAAIATVLSMDPVLLAMDEPTAGLDPKSRRELIALLKRLPQTLVIATHDLALAAELASRVVVLNRGKIVADGNAANICGNKLLLLENDLV